MSQSAPGFAPTDRSLAVAADARSNLIRIAAIATFYLVHLLHVWPTGTGTGTVAGILGLGESSVSRPVHLAISVLAFGWMIQAFLVHSALGDRGLGHRAALAVAVGDAGWLTAILAVSTGPRGPMVAGYFLIVVLAGLRLNLWLVRWATFAAAAGYLVLLGVARWPMGILRESGLESVPRYHQLMTLLAIVFCGVATGQIVRLAWACTATVPAAGERRHE